MSNPILHKTSSLENFGAGTLSGMAAAICEQPLVSFKNARQQSVGSPKPISLGYNPRVWYRGFGPFAASVTLPISFQATLYQASAPLTSPLAAAALTGALSSVFVVSPAELLMNQQKVSAQPLLKTARSIYANQGILGFWRGNLTMMCREIPPVYAWAYAAPLVKKNYQEQGVSDKKAQAIAGLLTGTPAALCTHPFDTVTTQRQCDFSLNKPLKCALFQKGAFTGFGWRWGVIVIDCTIIPWALEQFKSLTNKQ